MRLANGENLDLFQEYFSHEGTNTQRKANTLCLRVLVAKNKREIMKDFVKLFYSILLASIIFFGCQSKTVKSVATTFVEEADSIVAAFPDFNGVILMAKTGGTAYYKAFGFRNC